MISSPLSPPRSSSRSISPPIQSHSFVTMCVVTAWFTAIHPPRQPREKEMSQYDTILSLALSTKVCPTCGLWVTCTQNSKNVTPCEVINFFIVWDFYDRMCVCVHVHALACIIQSVNCVNDNVMSQCQKVRHVYEASLRIYPIRTWTLLGFHLFPIAFLKQSMLLNESSLVGQLPFYWQFTNVLVEYEIFFIASFMTLNISSRERIVISLGVKSRPQNFCS